MVERFADSATAQPSAQQNASGEGWTLIRGRWQSVLSPVRCGAWISDPPYSERTHRGAVTGLSAGDAPEYGWLTPDQVHELVAAWSPVVTGWMVALCDHELIPAYEAAYLAAGRCSFAPVACCISGMAVRKSGDGPSSEVVYAMVARPRSIEFMGGWARRGYYNGPASVDSSGGRGKPRWLMNALVRDYSRPGDLVVDPFAGWGTTLAAAVGLGRRAIGAECDDEAFTEALRRLRRPNQLDLLEG